MGRRPAPPRRARFELAGKSLEHPFGVPFGLHAAESPDHIAVFLDDEGRALDAHRLAPGPVALNPDAVLLGDLMAGVGEQRERQRVLFAEARVRRLVIGADPENDGTPFSEEGVLVA